MRLEINNVFFQSSISDVRSNTYISTSHGMSRYLPLNRPIGWYVIAIIIWHGFYCISLRNTNNKIRTRGNDSFILIQDLALVFKWLWICCQRDLYNHSFKKCYRTTLVQIHASGWVTFTLVTQVCVCVYLCSWWGTVPLMTIWRPSLIPPGIPPT